MPIILTVLRVVHIVAGAFWAGSALMLALVRSHRCARSHWVASNVEFTLTGPSSADHGS
jgi:putative copper export protein